MRSHRFHEIAEQIISHFKTVNKLIANLKQNFTITPSRVQLFKNKLFRVNLLVIMELGEPVLIQWGTWINAAVYHYKNVQVICCITRLFDLEYPISHKKAQKCLKKQNLKSNLAYIKLIFLFYL